MTLNTLKEIADLINDSSSIIVTSHISPDADAIGSCFGLSLGLQKLEKNTDTYLYSTPPDRGATLIAGLNYINQIPQKKYDLAIVTDTATKKRIGADYEEFLKLGKKTIVLDHHVSNPGYGDVNFIADYSSSSEIIFELLQVLKISFCPQILNLLLGGLMDDTGSFRFSNTSFRSLQNAAELVRLGADPAYVSNLLYYSAPKRIMKLKALALSQIRWEYQNRLAIVTVDDKLLETAGARVEDTDILVEELRSLDGVEVAVLMRRFDDSWKFSLRSKKITTSQSQNSSTQNLSKAIDVNKVASIFEGGGHAQAAGFTSKLNKEEALTALVEAFKGSFL